MRTREIAARKAAARAAVKKPCGNCGKARFLNKVGLCYRCELSKKSERRDNLFRGLPTRR